jgi:hypothetical protein
MLHSNFFGSVSTTSGSSPSTAVFLPGPPVAHGDNRALKSVPAPDLIERAKRRMSSV